LRRLIGEILDNHFAGTEHNVANEGAVRDGSSGPVGFTAHK
jgi:hypothetical protein